MWGRRQSSKGGDCDCEKQAGQQELLKKKDKLQALGKPSKAQGGY